MQFEHLNVDGLWKNVHVQAEVNWRDVEIERRKRYKSGEILAMVEMDLYVCPCQSGGLDWKKE